MTPLRLLIVTPRYWPLTGGTEAVAALLVDQLAQRPDAVSVTVLTAQWDASWPEEVIHHGARVTRLSPAPRGGWSAFRFLRVLGRWVRAHDDEYDVVYVLNLRHEAYTALGARRDDRLPPVVLRTQRSGASGDCHWQHSARFGRRILRRCQLADAVVAPTVTAANELLETGYLRDQVTVIPDGAVETGDRSEARRHHARQSLADVNHDFACAEFAPVAVAVERLVNGRGLSEMIRAWRIVATRWPSAKLWLIGDGPGRESLYEQIVDLGLHHRLIIPGSFDDLAEVFHAADVYLSPSPDCCVTPQLLQAMAAGLPVITADAPDGVDLIEDGTHGLIASSESDWIEAISKLFEVHETASQLGAAARQHVQTSHSITQMVDAHVELFQRLAGANR